MPFCTQCGHANPDESRFCSNCGAALRGAPPADATSTTLSIQGLEAPVEGESAEGLSAADQAAVDALPGGSALLVVRRGPNSGSRFLLDADVTTAGRHPDSDIFLDDVTVSRRHAEFVRTGDGFRVRDVGSLNGTYLNRERIDEAGLTNRDEVQIGKYRLVFFDSQNSQAGPTSTAAGGSAP
jgi:pSer/pThr/pTyr-binding forkhead associated (FHA) protein